MMLECLQQVFDCGGVYTLESTCIWHMRAKQYRVLYYISSLNVVDFAVAGGGML
jgi:hypothetical protein